MFCLFVSFFLADFEGRHCQYRKGTAPDYELVSSQQKKSKGGVDPWIKTLIALICLSVVGGFGYIVYENYNQKQLDTAQGNSNKNTINRSSMAPEDVTDLQLDISADSVTKTSEAPEIVLRKSQFMATVDVPISDEEIMDADKGEMA